MVPHQFTYPGPLPSRGPLLLRTTGLCSSPFFFFFLPVLTELYIGSSCLHLSENKSYVPCSIPRFENQPEQIIKEKLAFPSGTATAQLIAVLHKLPPPTEPNANSQEYAPLITDEEHSEGPNFTTGESPDQTSSHLSQGWRSLAWSLMLSASITVCRALSICLDSVWLRYLASRLLLPCTIFYSTLWHLPCQRMVVDIFSQFIVYRARCIHSQLSHLISHYIPHKGS